MYSLVEEGPLTDENHPYHLYLPFNMTSLVKHNDVSFNRWKMNIMSMEVWRLCNRWTSRLFWHRHSRRCTFAVLFSVVTERERERESYRCDARNQCETCDQGSWRMDQSMGFDFNAMCGQCEWLE